MFSVQVKLLQSQSCTHIQLLSKFKYNYSFIKQHIYISCEAKYILATTVCVSLCLSLATFPHYCTGLDVTWKNGRGCPLVLHYWADLRSVHGFRCYDDIHVCKLIVLHTANAYSTEREMSASACTHSMTGSNYWQTVTSPNYSMNSALQI